MALSGSFSGSTNNQYIKPTIEWSAVQSIDGNYSDVTATLKYSRTNTGYTTSGTWSGGIVVNSSTTVGSKYLEITYNSGTVAISTTVRVYHNEDGTRITTIGAYGGIPGTSFSTTDISSTITLDTIPRATTPVAVNMTLGMPAPITLKPASSAFRHTIVCNFGNESVLIADKTASTSINWTPPLSLAEQIPKSKYGVATIVCTTYNGNVYIGTKSVSINLTIPNSMVPTISSVSVSENVSGLNEKFGAFVQSKSKLAIAVSASGIYGSTIASCQTGFEGVFYSGLSVITNTISGSGKISLTVNVTDTRGMSATTTTTVNVLEYSSPTISRLSAYRVTPEGVEDDDGERIALRISYKKASVGGKNGGTLSVSYREESELAFLQISSESAQNAFDDVILYTTEPVISVDNAYVIRVTLQDFFSTINADTRVESSFSLMDFHSSGTGISFGKSAVLRDTMEINMDVQMDKKLYVLGDVEAQGSLTISGGIPENSFLVGAGDRKPVVAKSPEEVKSLLGLADYVVDRGVSGIWTYRKWASGVAECWGYYTTSSVSMTNPWGSLYESTTPYKATFPRGLFSDTPTYIDIQAGYAGGVAAFIERGGSAPSATATDEFYFVRPTSFEVGGMRVFINAIGKWK